MARIKTEKYEIEGQEIAVNYNCSSSGIFSCNLSFTMTEKLGIKSKLEGKSLTDIEDIISKAFVAYKEANTSYELLIGITYGAGGEFKKKENGVWDERFYPFSNNRLNISVNWSELNSIIGIDFRVLIKENRDGRISYYQTRPLSEPEYQHRKLHNWEIVVDGYVSSQKASIREVEKLIKYSDISINNLRSINEQLRKASIFLLDLVSSDNLELILSNDKMNALTQ